MTGSLGIELAFDVVVIPSVGECVVLPICVCKFVKTGFS